MVPSAAIDDVRLSTGLYDLREASRLIDLPEQTFHRWAKGYEHGAPLLHMLDRDARRESSVPFIALAEAWVLDGLRRAGVRPRKIRPGLDELKREFGLSTCSWRRNSPPMASICCGTSPARRPARE
ncbi:MAG: hypothetical protein ACR2GH_18870 [Pseudonocardia sp.]